MINIIRTDASILSFIMILSIIYGLTVAFSYAISGC